MKESSVFFLIAVVWGCSSGATINPSLEDQLGQLATKYNEIKDLLMAKDTQRLEEKIVRLEEKISALENRLQWQEAALSSSGFKDAPTGKALLPRSCQEAFEQTMSPQSGFYTIDPDGENIGELPFSVYCDKTSDGLITTQVSHDSESTIQVTKCNTPGCYTRPIAYASLSQMIALAEISNECHQTIKYDCINAPLEYSGTQYSWWLDRNGKEQYFWSGEATATHQCECGIRGNCAVTGTKCQCDAALSILLSDDGTIKAKELLPITQLNFGRALGSGNHTLGRFICSGKATTNRMPTSCVDLKKIGHSLNGLYSIAGAQSIQTVYCDFSKAFSDQGMETLIGSVDVKTSAVEFYVQRTGDQSTIEDNKPIPFDIAVVNVGNAMNLETGIFTAPKTGLYFFSWSGIGFFEGSTVSLLNLAIRQNRRSVAQTVLDSIDRQYKTYSIQSTLNLKVGDEISVVAVTRQGADLYDSKDRLTHFNGMLLEEDLFGILNQPLS